MSIIFTEHAIQTMLSNCFKAEEAVYERNLFNGMVYTKATYLHYESDPCVFPQSLFAHARKRPRSPSRLVQRALLRGRVAAVLVRDERDRPGALEGGEDRVLLRRDA